MNDIERAINGIGYNKGNYSKFGEEYWQKWYAGSSGRPETSMGDVFIVGDEIIVANSWKQQVIAKFYTVEAFVAFCDRESGSAGWAWSQGMYDG